MLMMLEPHTELFVAPTEVGSTQLALDLLIQEYLNPFDYVVILCPTIRHNENYCQWKWFWTDPDVIPVDL